MAPPPFGRLPIGVRRRACAATVVVATLALAVTTASFTGGATARAAGLSTGTAPGCCGSAAIWAAGDKTFLGRAEAPAGTGSDVWFTGADGALSEVFYPNLDTADFTDQQFIVGDSAHTWDQSEKSDATHSVTLANNNALAWTVTNTGSNGDWRIAKTVYADPNRPVVVEHVTFTALHGTLGDYVLYQLSNPTQEDNGNADTGQTLTYDGRPMLVASGPNRGNWASDASAIAVGNGLGWASQAGTLLLSSGFVGTNDGWQDLLGGSADHAMNDAYSLASGGNVAQMGQLDLAPVASRTSVSFDLAIGLGMTTTAAESAADATLSALASSPGSVQSSYDGQWESWLSSLDTYGDVGGEQYRAAMMAIKAAQDPSTGAIVAGIGTPWGTSRQTDDYGYHRSWSRDLFNSATALLLAGDNADADAAEHFLLDRQQESDGHFPQNSFVDGSPSWTGVQLDETAYPIVLAWQLRSYDPALVGSTYYQQHIRPAAAYLVAHGPATPMERWEENSGYSPSSLAAEIAGLYLASKIASANGDTANASSYQATADSWARQVVSWTYTTDGPYGNHNYFVRITPGGNPNDGTNVAIANGGGTYNENSIVDGGFLQFAILGILPANDLHVANTVAIVANPDNTEASGSLEQLLPDGIDFFRYNHDGYGETSTGGDFTGAGIGRLWPILDAEFGQYRAMLGESAGAYVRDLQHYATSSYQIPEQVWDLNPPAGSVSGTPTRSMSPLNWSMALYVQLTAAFYGQQHGSSQLPGMPVDVYDHYAAVTAEPVTTTPSPPVAGQPVTVRYDGSLAAGATSVTMHWGHDGWQGVTDTPMTRQSDGSWTASVRVPVGAGLDAAFVNQSGTWDNNSGANYEIGALDAPVSTSPTALADGAGATIRYAGTLAAGATSLTIHWGHDGWQGVTDTPMIRQSDGSWTASVTIPAGSTLDMAFHNQSGTWDNNSGHDYGAAIR